VRVSEDRVFDLMVEMVEFASAHGLVRTAQALEGALDAFLQDKGLAPQALPVPDAAADPGRARAALAGDSRDLVGGAGQKAAIAAATALDPALAGAAFRTRRPLTQPRRLHLLPSQRVAV